MTKHRVCGYDMSFFFHEPHCCGDNNHLIYLSKKNDELVCTICDVSYVENIDIEYVKDQERIGIEVVPIRMVPSRMDDEHYKKYIKEKYGVKL